MAQLWLTAFFSFVAIFACAKAVTFEYFPGVGYYYVYTSNQAWVTGHKACQDYGGNLGVINSEAEARVFDLLVTRHNQSMWVGISDLLVPRTLVTVHGELVKRTGYNEWVNGTPGENPATQCTQFSLKEGAYEKVNCASTNYSICEIPVWGELQSGDYTLIPGLGHYKMHEHAKTFEEAWSICEAEGAHLVVINSELEYAIVQRILHAHQVHPDADFPNYFHVGIHSKYTATYYVTVDGLPVAKSGYNVWDSPPTSTAYKHATLKLDGHYGQNNPNLKLGFVCEHELV